MSVPGGHVNERRVRFVAEPMSVPVARRFVSDSVTGSGLPHLAEDAALLVGELSANAALHSGSHYFDVSIRAAPSSVRIGVSDDGSAVAVAARRSRLIERDDEAVYGSHDFDAAELGSTTGRGLVIVSALADRWGVDETAEGKLVWGELTSAGRAEQGAGTRVIETQTTGAKVDARVGKQQQSDPRSAPAQQANDAATAPESAATWVRVQLVDAPVALSHEFDAHVQDLVRELQLIRSGTLAWTTEMARVIDELIGRHTGSWRLSQAVFDQGVREQRDLVTLDLMVPPGAADDVLDLKDALDLTDRLCERNELLVLASSPDVRRLRAWMATEFVTQIRTGRDPVPWPEFTG